MIQVLAAVVALSLSVVSVSELDGDPETWNGRDVTVRGEIVGDYSRRASVMWLQLNDDAYAEVPLAERPSPAGVNSGIAVRIPSDLWSSDWGEPGRHGVRGPILEVTGVFLHNSGADQGETFVNGKTVILVEAARPIDRPEESPVAAIVGIALGAMGLVLYRYGRLPRYRTP